MSNRVTISLKRLPVLDRRHGAGNPLLSIFPTFDLATVILMFFSLFALAFSYNMVCGEKEAGTLGLLLANRVRRTTLLLGKTTAGLLTLLIPLICFFGLALVMLEVIIPEAIGSSGWLDVLLLLLSSMLYITVFYLLGGLFSTVARSSATSLLLSLCCWAVLVVVMPQVVFSLSAATSDAYSNENLRQAAAQLSSSYFDRYNLLLSNEPPPPEETTLRHQVQFSPLPGFILRDPDPEIVAYYAPHVERIEQEMADSMSRLTGGQYEYYRALYVQQQTLSRLQLVSPAGAYYFLTTALCGTGGSAYFHFLTACFRYRGQLLDDFRSKHLFASPAMFTARDPSDVKSLPPFIERDGQKEDLRQILLGFGYLILVAVITFAMTYVLFLRFDVR